MNNKKEELRKKIAESNIVESVKVFLILNIDKFDDEQVNWLLENLK
jgi:hypothetical protein